MVAGSRRYTNRRPWRLGHYLAGVGGETVGGEVDMKRSVAVAVAALALTITSCGSASDGAGSASVDDNSVEEATTTTAEELLEDPATEQQVSTTGAPVASESSLADACDAFYDVIGDFTMDDETTAVELYEVASSAGAHPQFEHAVRDIADAFAAHEEDIFSTPVNAICGTT